MAKHKYVIYKLAVILLVLSAGLCSVPPGVNPDILSQTESLGDCQACKLFVASFKKGLERTSRGKYEGGDAAWEEEKLKKAYRRSEMRLVDIQEGLCKEVSKYSIQCHQYADKAEELVEQWWAQDPEESEDLYAYICIDNLKVCCPAHHYGKDCTPCPGDHKNLCSGNGKCRGEGTRKGNGTCMCIAGYTGLNCDLCDIGYYLSYKDANKILCSPCHISCSGACRGSTQKDCEVCKTGFILDREEGCMDINECEDENICMKNEFCLNSLGSYMCGLCDNACEGCHGRGPDMCRKCAQGFSMKGEFCIQDSHPTEIHTEILTSARNDEL